VQEIGAECGFEVETDIMRIPSTKRVCHIGRRRVYTHPDEGRVYETKRRKLAHSGEDFRPRDKEIRVRNCVSVDRELQDRIVAQVVERILVSAGESSESGGASAGGAVWRCGGALPIAEAAQLFGREVLRELKDECGGLQTLLKNHHHVFVVRSGEVRLKDFREWAGRPRPGHAAFKRRQCWFHAHHPDGCPMSTHECPFAHGPEDVPSASEEAARRV
jgi:tRNASer (uridine44-2'-O)-methyltransferase